MFDEYPDILTVSDLEKALNIGRNMAYSLLKQNAIKCFKIGNKYKIPKSSLLEYVYNTVTV